MDAASDFLLWIKPGQLRELEAHPGVAYGLRPDLRLAYRNPAWRRFALENGGGERMLAAWPLGRNILDAVAAPLRPFYEQLLGDAARRTDRPRQPPVHEYDCPSPELYRRFAMTLYPLGGHGVIVMHSLRVECPQASGEAAPITPAGYLDRHGFFTQCAHCRRYLEHTGGGWHWIPAWVKAYPGEVSHTLCPVCFEYYYGSHEPDEDAD